MRWLDHPSPSGQPPDALLKRLLAECSATTGQPPSLKDVDIEALADALNRVLSERRELPASPYRVVELSARTLGDLGAGDLARHLLVFGSGLVSPSVWEASGGDRIWVLDLRRLAVDSGVQIELALFRCLDAAIAAMADVWDASAGQGRLGLRHVGVTAERLLGDAGRPQDRRSRAAFTRELLHHSRARLDALSSQRHWSHTPEVLSLD